MKSQYKPNQLVWVKQPGYAEQGSYSYIGEVMSYVIPDTTRDARLAQPTIMVRRVPGHPGTLEEMPVSQLSALHGTTRYRFVEYVTVLKGVGEWPVDMLRYDNCAPVNFKFKANRWGVFCVPEIDPSFGFEDTIVAKVCRTRTGATWTPERWKSFLYHIRGLKVIPLDDTAVL